MELATVSHICNNKSMLKFWILRIPMLGSWTVAYSFHFRPWTGSIQQSLQYLHFLLFFWAFVRGSFLCILKLLWLILLQSECRKKNVSQWKIIARFTEENFIYCQYIRMKTQIIITLIILLSFVIGDIRIWGFFFPVF